MKALSVGLGAFGFHDVEVLVDPGADPSGPPRLLLRGPAAEIAAQLGVHEFFVSLTHTATIAQAMVLAQATSHSQAFTIAERSENERQERR